MIPGLDGLRAIAFLLIFALHTDYLQIGWVGVQLFFVLSGFLITDILLGMKKSLPTNKYFLYFYGRRFLRIFPLYYLYLFGMTLLAGWLISIGFRPNYMKIFLDQVRYAYAYVYDFRSALESFQGSWFLDHLWSLSIEEQFYIFWPLLIFLAPEKSLKKLFLTFIVLGPVFRIAVFFLYHFPVFSFLRDPASLAVYPLPFSHVDAFAFGAYITRFGFPKAKLQFFVLLLTLPIVGFATHYAATGELGAISAFGFPVTLPDAYQYLWAYTPLNYFFAICIYCVVREGMLVRFLEWKVLRYLGRISYGLYVYHFPVVWFALRIRDLGVDESAVKPLGALMTFTGTLILASLSYFLMEKPILSLKDRFFSVKPKPATAVSVAQESASGGGA
jgi:peptidoglycan/LPS O-acetylase OafA/YrhL